MTTCKLAALHVFSLCLCIIFLVLKFVFVPLKFQIETVDVNKIYFMLYIDKAVPKLVAQGYKWKDNSRRAPIRHCDITTTNIRTIMTR